MIVCLDMGNLNAARVPVTNFKKFMNKIKFYAD